MMRCWQEPGICDNPFVQSIDEAKYYFCDEYRTKEERKKDLFEEAKKDYMYYKKHIKELEEKYPSLKDLV